MVAIILRSSLRLLSLATTSIFPTELPSSVTFVTILLLPIAITVGGTLKLLPLVTMPTSANVLLFSSFKTRELSASGFRVLSSKNSTPVSITTPSTISPISVPITSNFPPIPVVVPTDVIAGKSLILTPAFTILTE